jgi:hypothetical protein
MVAAAGWLLFLYWWWLVLARLDPAHVRFTLLFIGITLVVCVALTAGWALHNLRIFRRKTPRDHVPTATYEFKRDRLGRHLFFADRAELVARAQVVQIRLEHEGKVYRAFEKLAARSTTTPATMTGTSATTTSEAQVVVPPPPSRASSEAMSSDFVSGAEPPIPPRRPKKATPPPPETSS